MKVIPFGKPILGSEEKDLIGKVLDSGMLVHGQYSVEFERAFAQFAGSPNAVSVASCTAALHLSYLYLGIGPGDEVIVPAQTHVATAHAVEFCGATPVFVDADRDTGNIDLEQLAESITERTKAISVVHFLGLPVDMDQVNSLASKHQLFVVEDCALSIGAYYKGKHTGLLGDVGCFSFYPVKHMTTAEGGMLITRHDDVAEHIRKIKAFGLDRTVDRRNVPGMYDVVALGYNYRMNELAAALGIEQLKRLPGFLERRKENYELLRELLRGVEEIHHLESTNGDFQSSYYCYSAILKTPFVEQRMAIMKYLKDHGVGCSIYYPRPVPHFTYYREKYGYTSETFPVARWLSDGTISLPVGPHVTQEDISHIASTFKQAIVSVS